MSDPLVRALLRIAIEAGQVISQLYRQDFQVDYKSPGDPVTDADRRANELICDRLAQQFPGIPVVAEESDSDRFAGFRQASQIFFVDPLDGTREFVAHNDDFVVMIGLVDGARASHGVIHAPARRVSWGGGVATGAFRIDASGRHEPIRTSDRTSLSEATVTASRTSSPRALERAVRKLGARAVVPLGSAGLKAAAVADGRADVYVAPYSAGKRWDAAAPDAIVSAAGGCFTDKFGEALDYRGARLENDRGVVAAPKGLHGQVLRALSRLGIA